jgi:hypothetical protein
MNPEVLNALRKIDDSVFAGVPLTVTKESL